MLCIARGDRCPTVAKLVDAVGRRLTTPELLVRLLESASATAVVPRHTIPIRPPYRFAAVDAMMTNFHLPRTTLLVLVRTFVATS